MLVLVGGCASTRPGAASSCNERCEFGRASIMPILAVERARAPEKTVFCVRSELDLSSVELGTVLESCRALGIDAWVQDECPARAGPRVGLLVRQVKRSSANEEWWVPFELGAPVDHVWSGSVVVRKAGGRWSLVRLEYDDWRPSH